MNTMNTDRSDDITNELAGSSVFFQPALAEQRQDQPLMSGVMATRRIVNRSLHAVAYVLHSLYESANCRGS